MIRQPNKVKNRAVVGIVHDVHKAGKWIFRRSQTGEEHPTELLETAVEVSNGSSAAYLITSEMDDYGTRVSQTDELATETAKPAEELSEMDFAEVIFESGTPASQADELDSTGVTEAQAKAPATVDECLIDKPTPRRTNLTTVILPKVYGDYAFAHEGTVLYEKQRGQWVAELLPEKTDERVAQTVSTYSINGVMNFERVA